MNGTESENEDQLVEPEENIVLLSGDLIGFLNLFGRITNKTLGDIIGDE